MERFEPVRVRLDDRERARLLAQLLDRSDPCRLCPRECGARRQKGEAGECGAGARAPVAFYGAHFGEEPPLSGVNGAGNVFFSGCNVNCVFCQNHQISRPAGVCEGQKRDAGELAGIFLSLQREGCHNLCWVTPSHVVFGAVQALVEADRNGLSLPVVYNSSGYDHPDTLRLLEPVVDIYLPDFKYGPNAAIDRLCRVDDYWDVARAAVSEMWRQKGPIAVDDQGIGIRGVVVRHLVMPEDLADTRSVLEFLALDLGVLVPVSLMAQYTPAVPGQDSPLNRPLRPEEYQSAVDFLEALGLTRGWVQALSSSRCFTPDFSLERPFDPGLATRDHGLPVR